MADSTSISHESAIWDGINQLMSCPRALWHIFFLKYLESYAYYVLSYTLILYLSDEFGFSDEEAGWAYGIYGMLISVYGFLMGTVIDNIGVKASLIGGLIILFFSRVILTFVTDARILCLVLFTTLPLGGCLGIPVMQIAVKRYSTNTNRTTAFAMFYVMMNLAAITAAPAIDLFHNWLPNGVSFETENSIVFISTYRLLIFSGAIVNLLCLGVAWWTLRHADPSLEPPPARGTAIFNDVMKSPSFWRFLFLCMLLTGVRMIYRHLDATFPKYMVREFGPDALYGSVIAINPLCVVILVPVLAPLTRNVHPLKMILFGTFISAMSPFALAMGHTYPTAISFVSILSVGESIWSPRLYEYSVMVAEPGREGTYMALSSAPMFVATLLTGFMSGWFLDTFCPEEGPKRSEMMWGIIASISLLSPITLFVFYDWIAEDALLCLTKGQRVSFASRLSELAKPAAFRKGKQANVAGGEIADESSDVPVGEEEAAGLVSCSSENAH